MAKMADLASKPGVTEQENAAEEAPVYKSTVHLHADDMKKMGMEHMAPGDELHGEIHGKVSNAHEGGMMAHMTHGALKKHGKEKSKAEKMYGKEEHGEPDGDEGA